MHFRTSLYSIGLATLSLSGFVNAATGPTNYTVGTLSTSNLVWQKPDAVKRNQADAAAFCAASTNGGLTGWTVPNRTDLANLYFEKGNSYLSDNGWVLDVYQTASQALDGSGLVVSMVNGSTSGGNALGYTTCVNTPGPTGMLTNKNLSFLRPDGTLRNLPTAEAYCSSNTTGGLQGWRLPTDAEISELYFLYGPTNLATQGWPATINDWVWTANPYNSSRDVFNLNSASISNAAASSTYAVTCVRDKDALTKSTVISSGLRWHKPDATNRGFATAQTFCSSSTLNGVTGWRLPTLVEIQALYYDKGWLELSYAGWPGAYLWASDVLSSGHAVLRVTDGMLSYGTNDVLPTTCVRPVTIEKYASINNANLTWAKPALRSRPVENAINYCESTIIGDKGGWRMPTDAEVQALYATRGSSLMTQSGFPAAATGLWTEESAATEADNIANVEGNGTRLFLACVINTTTAAYDKLVANGMQWEKPGTLVRHWTGTEFACNDKAIGGQTGWRLPSYYELQALRTTVGSSALTQMGWNMSWNWTYDFFNSNHIDVVRLSDGLVSNTTTAYTERFAVPCVRDANGYPTTTFSNAGLTFVLPKQAAPQPLTPATPYCANATIAGLTGWRTPTLAELSALYTAKTTKLVEAGWPADWVWSSTPVSGGVQVLRMSDGQPSWASAVDTNRAYVACVR